MRRFEREARAAAALNHPNIVTVHEVGEWEGQPFIATEFVEGETLAQRLSRGSLSVGEALPVGEQIADALAAAHDAGIVHRDLKPGNIMLRPDGTVKVLDFGLARLLRAPAEFSAGAAETETLTVSGRIMGTLNYMSPEQARGQNVDKRADIWSFGVVLYEMLTGKQLFQRENVSDTLAAVLKEQPDLSRVPANARRLLQRCLEKDPKKRLRDIGDAMPLLEDAPAASNQPKSKLSWAVAVGLGLALIVLGVLLWRATRPVDRPLTRLSVDLGPDAMTGLNLTAAISPDGRRLVFPARGPDGKQQLATRLLDQPQATLLPGTENGKDAFFSPDSQWVGFFADSKLKKISVQGGAPVILCDASVDFGASWGEDGTIIAGLNQASGLSRVPAAGGRPQPFTKLSKGETTHRWPQILPGGQAVLFTASPTIRAMENANVEAISLKSGVIKTLFTGGYFARYLPANGDHGYLEYLHQGVLFGVAFDSGRLELQGTPVPLLEDVAASRTQGGGQFDFSSAPSGHGTVVYLAGKRAAQTWPVMWLDSSGKMQPLIATPGAYTYPRFSPDGRRLALQMNTSSGTDIYVYDLDGAAHLRRTRVGTGLDSRLAIPLDSIAEFEVQSQNFSASIGMTAGGQISVASPSGANAFHGGAFDYFRNNVFDSRSPFDGSSPNPFLLNQSGRASAAPSFRIGHFSTRTMRACGNTWDKPRSGWRQAPSLLYRCRPCRRL